MPGLVKQSQAEYRQFSKHNLHPPRKCLFGIHYTIKMHLYHDFNPLKGSVINYFKFIYLGKLNAGLSKS